MFTILSKNSQFEAQHQGPFISTVNIHHPETMFMAGAEMCTMPSLREETR